MSSLSEHCGGERAAEAPWSGASGRCTVEFRVRYAECDAQGHLHHAKYWEYFEHARTELLRRNGFRYRDMEASGVLFVVYKATCKYLSPIRYDDVVSLTVMVERVTRARVDHSYVIKREVERVCEALSTLACVGRDGRPRRMPEALWSSRPLENQTVGRPADQEDHRPVVHEPA